MRRRLGPLYSSALSLSFSLSLSLSLSLSELIRQGPSSVCRAFRRLITHAVVDSHKGISENNLQTYSQSSDVCYAREARSVNCES
jgi:hypothetical protein